MSIGIFSEKECPPKEAEIWAAVGPAIKSFNGLTHWICESLAAQQDLKFMYGRKYGWARRFQIRGRLLAALYPTQNGFTAQIILNRAALEQATRLQLGESAKQAIARAHLYTEGKWLFNPVESERDAQDVQRLLQLKVAGQIRKPSIRRQASATPG
jgi:hypothetical protein